MGVQQQFSAMVLTARDSGVDAKIQSFIESDLPAGDVLVRIEHSSLNYKDGLILNGLGKLVRTYPHVPGIDFSGKVVRSSNPKFAPDDPVILTGWRVGEIHWGGYSQFARVNGSWLVKQPSELTSVQAMAVGTAGLTAMLAVMALEKMGLAPSSDVVVTGASGGVGSIAVTLLSSLGHSVTAVTGRSELGDYLTRLGAAQIIGREELNSPPSKPLNPERWDGAVDAVGGEMLANLLTQIRYRGSVAACGLAGGSNLSTTVIPFLLRGVNLLGIDSVMSPATERETAWARIARELPRSLLEEVTQIIPLNEVKPLADAILKGRVRGRIVVDVNQA